MAAGLLALDGSRGEGGGQILRTALALSLCTGTPFRIERIRARRRKPGLLRQHLTAVQAAAAIGRAGTDGAELHSQTLEFRPGTVRPGDYRFDIGTAGSCTLVLQAVLAPLALAAGPSTVRLRGGTHNPMAPPFDFVASALRPLLGRCGIDFDLELLRPGFHPAGGGEIEARIRPSAGLRPLELLQRGRQRWRRARVLLCDLPRHIGERELQIVRRAGLVAESECRIETLQGAASPGNFLAVEFGYEQVTELFSGIGERGVPAEKVARRTVAEARRYLATDAPVGFHLADQLLLPLALAGGGAFRTLEPSLHTRTNAEVIGRFLPVGFAFNEDAGSPGTWRIEVQGS